MRRFNSSHAFEMKLYQVATRLKCTFIFFHLTPLHFEKMYLSHIGSRSMTCLSLFVSPVVLSRMFSFKYNIYFVKEIPRRVSRIIFQTDIFIVGIWFSQSWFHLSKPFCVSLGADSFLPLRDAGGWLICWHLVTELRP